MRRNRVLGLAEMMNFPGVVAGLPVRAREARARRRRARRRPRARARSARGCRRTRPSGIRSDHECLTADEGRERLRAGMWLLIREASMARNLKALLPLARRVRPEPDRLLHRRPRPRGHRRQRPHQRDGARGGRARHHAGGRDRDGVVQPGPVARAPRTSARSRRDTRPTCCSCPTSSSFVPDLVLKRGRPVEDVPSPPVPEWVRQTVRVKPVTAADFEIPSDGATIRAIGLIEDQVVTESLEREPVVVDGYAVAERRCRPRQDRRRRAAPRDRPDRARLRLGLGPDARRARLVGRARRPQPRRRRHERQRPGVRRQPPRRRSAAASSSSTTAASSPSARFPSPGCSRTRRSRR